MGKFLFMLLLAAIAWALFKKRSPPRRPDPAPDPSSTSTPSGRSTANGGQPSPGSERMLACSACGVFMPESESVQQDGRVSCRDPAHCAHRPT
jgi:hypothetical protein